METLAKLYPPADQRSAVPVLYIPVAYFAIVLSTALPSRSYRIACGLLVFALALYWPNFTTGEKGADCQISACFFLGSLQGVLDQGLLLNSEGDPPMYLGHEPVNSKEGISYVDCPTAWERLVWLTRLHTTAQGIGWNWQVKIPDHPHASLSRRLFARKHGLIFVNSLICVKLLSIAIGVANELHDTSTRWLMRGVSAIAVGWLSVAYILCGFQYVYSIAIFISMALDGCSPWEWPPMFGKLSEAYSIRRTWSVTYHQICRRALHQPCVRLARLLGLRKGSITSAYLQLFTTFFLSMLLHEWNIFAITRHDTGEFVFFMSQPIAIQVEEVITHYLKSRFGQEAVSRWWSLGSAWTALWFSYCLPPYFLQQIEVNVIVLVAGDEQWLANFGRLLARWYLM